VRGGPELPQLHHEVGGIIGPIGAHGDRLRSGAPGDQLERRQAVGEAGGVGQLGLDHQTVAILHQQVAHEAEPRFLTMTLAKQPRIRIGGRGVAGVGPVLAVEVSARVATTVGWLILIILRAEALQAGPGLDQGAVDREVLAAQQGLDLRVAQEGGEEARCHLAREQPVAVGREDGRVPDRIVDPEPDKPAIQKVVVELLLLTSISLDAMLLVWHGATGSDADRADGG
jgi:hypothetical protein